MGRNAVVEMECSDIGSGAGAALVFHNLKFGFLNFSGIVDLTPLLKKSAFVQEGSLQAVVLLMTWVGPAL